MKPTPPEQKIAQSESRIAFIERLDHILFTEWDPIGVHFLEGFDCEREYRSYLPVIVDMVINEASASEIADTLYGFEELIVGEDMKCRRRCQIAAAKILGRNPEADDQTKVGQYGFCQRRHSQSPKAHCIDSAAYGAKPSIHYID